MANKVTLNVLKKELNKLGLYPEDDKYYVPALVLLASLVCGPNADEIARFIKYPRSEVRPLSRRIRKNGIWRQGHVYCDWFNKETGEIEFLLDVNVAAGMMERSSA